jgi:hypothetical protein
VVSNATVWVREHFATAPAIYGLVVFQVLIAAESDDPHDPALLVLLWAVLSFLGFYIAHVFAEVVARHGAVELGLAIRHGFAHSAGMLYAAILPTLTILIAAAAGSSGNDAAGWALLVGLFVLAFLGYQATAQRRKRIWSRILGGIATALIGLVVIIIEYVVH